MPEQNEGQHPGGNNGSMTGFPGEVVLPEGMSITDMINVPKDPENVISQGPVSTEQRLGAFGTGRIVVVDMSERSIPIPVGRETPQMFANGLNSPYERDALGRLVPRAPRR